MPKHFDHAKNVFGNVMTLYCNFLRILNVTRCAFFCFFVFFKSLIDFIFSKKP